MPGRTGKMGRGGGGSGSGSAGKRTIHVAPINRAVSTGRLPKGGGPRGRVGASSDSILSPPTTSLQVEESFSLVRENPLNFGMAIKLAPDLVDEIKRVEAQGGSACIKFDAHANNPGNVIRVGDKIYRFTWSKEPGDLCDIYEETQNGGDGNGLLVESGGAWRKLNVERELDESTKNLVKKRSEEAEQKLKSRKAIVLDPQNPSMKNQMKAIAAAESNPWRNFKNRKEFPSKKRKFEPTAVTAAGLPSSVSKSGSSATHISKANLSSSSPLLSHQDRNCPQSSPVGSGHHLKGYVGAPEVLSQSMDKTLDPDRETLPKLQNGSANEKVHNGNVETKASDVRGPMISLLLEHHDRGMLFKDIERTIGDAFPNSARQILPILKQIAICQASGRYFLKPGLEMESLNKLPSQSHSSPAMNHHGAPEHRSLSKPSSTEAVTKTKEKVALGVIPVHIAEDVEKIDILSYSPQHSNEKKILNNNDGVASSSDAAGSGTDSDSETDSDSGSNSRNQSGSQCSTDAQSDASSSSKHASDEEVDILTRDDDKEPLHKSPVDSGAPSLKSPVDIGDYGRHDAFAGGMIRIGNDLPQVGDNAEVRPTHLFCNEEGEEHVEQMQSSADHHEQDRGQIRGKIVDKAREPGAHDSSLIGGSKGHFDDTHCDVKNRNRKRFKSEDSSHPVSGTLNSIFGDSPVQSPDGRIVNGTLQNGTHGQIVQPDYNEVIPNSFLSDTQQVNQRSSEAFKLTDGRKKAFKNELLHGQASKYSENIQFRGGSGDKKFDGKGRVLPRELSDLELGELRETESPEDKEQFERKSPFKHPEEKPYDKFDEVGKLSPGNQEAVNSAIADPPSKRKATEHNANHIKHLHKDPKQHHQSFGKHVEVPEINGKARSTELGAHTKSHGDAGRKASTDSVGQNDSIPPISGTQVAKENRKQGHDIALSNGKRKRASVTGSNEGGEERKNSLDEIVSSYIKYEKPEPELKGPIKDTSWYQNYVKEYQEKYESYSSLHKILELYSNKFSKLDKELVDCKGQDKKKCAHILKQVVSLYNECGENFKRLKKIFLVLHVELQHLKQMMKDFAASYHNTT